MKLWRPLVHERVAHVHLARYGWTEHWVAVATAGSAIRSSRHHACVASRVVDHPVSHQEGHSALHRRLRHLMVEMHQLGLQTSCPSELVHRIGAHAHDPTVDAVRSPGLSELNAINGIR